MPGEKMEAQPFGVRPKPAFDFEFLLRPRTVAVVGVSLTNPVHPANVIYNKLDLRYPVRVFPVNPKGGELRRQPVYRDISEIPEPVAMDNSPSFLQAIPQGKVGVIQGHDHGSQERAGKERSRESDQDRIRGGKGKRGNRDEQGGDHREVGYRHIKDHAHDIGAQHADPRNNAHFA